MCLNFVINSECLRGLLLLMLSCPRLALPHPPGLQAPGNEITSPYRAWLQLNAPQVLACLLATSLIWLGSVNPVLAWLLCGQVD